MNIYKEGYDARFQAAQAIPVFINEIVVRLIYSVRRMIRYYSTVDKEQRSFKGIWKECEPFTNATVKRMLTVAHGTFCLVDVGDAVIRGFAAGAGLGVAVVTMGPTVAMGVATTFGVASTGTAISTLSGAAATNAALAWLGGGALAAGGGGMAAGEAF